MKPTPERPPPDPPQRSALQLETRREHVARLRRAEDLCRVAALAQARARELCGELLRVPLPREPGCGAHARGLLQTQLGHHPAATLQHAKTVLSELVNNAFIHGQGAIQLCLSHQQHRLRIDVIDEGAGAEIRITDGGLEGGNGLRIVDQLARRWGAREGTTHVWAELPLAPLAPAAPLPPPPPVV